jgi:leucyl aminopeptidase (aminopeptidase T)
MRSELVSIVHKIYGEMAHLTPGQDVLVISNSITAPDIVELFIGEAREFGATSQGLIVPTQPSAVFQPSIEWSPTVAAATTTPDLIVDLSIGYTRFMAEAVKRGARIISPGDGHGHENLEEVLIRTVGRVDLDAIRHEADQLAEWFTEANECRVTSAEGTDLVVDIGGLRGGANDGYLWDPDLQQWKTTWSLVPPAQPGVFLPTGRASGWIACDGFLIWEPDDIEFPKTPLMLHVADGYVDRIEGDTWLAPRLTNWLERLARSGDRSPYHGPVHLNIGTNPQAKLSQHLEFERVRGTITFGWGDNAMLFELTEADLPTVSSPVHWDCMIRLPSLWLDDRQVIDRGMMVEDLNAVHSKA